MDRGEVRQFTVSATLPAAGWGRRRPGWVTLLQPQSEVRGQDASVSCEFCTAKPFQGVDTLTQKLRKGRDFRQGWRWGPIGTENFPLCSSKGRDLVAGCSVCALLSVSFISALSLFLPSTFIGLLCHTFTNFL